MVPGLKIDQPPPDLCLGVGSFKLPGPIRRHALRATLGTVTALVPAPCDQPQVAADAKFSDLGADSLDTVEIMMALEEKFELQLDEEGAEKISTVQEAADLIAAQIGA